MTRATLRRDGDVLVLEGEIDFDSVPALVREAGSLGAGVGTVDASAVRRIDSAGVAFLVWLRRHHGTGSHLALRGASPQLTRLLAVTGLETVVG